jgi:hypothetical protein
METDNFHISRLHDDRRVRASNFKVDVKSAATWFPVCSLLPVIFPADRGFVATDHRLAAGRRAYSPVVMRFVA